MEWGKKRGECSNKKGRKGKGKIKIIRTLEAEGKCDEK